MKLVRCCVAVLRCDGAAVRLLNTSEVNIHAEEVWRIMAHSALRLDLPEGAELEASTGPRVQVLNDELVYAQSGISASSTLEGSAKGSLPDGDIEVGIGAEGAVFALQGPAVKISEGDNNRLINDG